MCLMAYKCLLLFKDAFVVLAIQQQKYWKTPTQVVLVLVTIFGWGLGDEDTTKSLNVFSAHQSLFFVGFLPQTLESISVPFFRNHFAAIFIHERYGVCVL